MVSNKKHYMKRTARKKNQEQRLTGIHVQPKNAKQQKLINAIKQNAINIAIGCAGTGKTYISAMTVANLYMSGNYDKIVLTRANVPTGRSLGFFPGTVIEKLTPWLAPITGVLKKAFGDTHYEYLLAKGNIELQPLETIRGMSYENTLIIVDEAQNLNFEEIKAITTRLGENSKLILSGDQSQSDVDNGKSLMKFVEMCGRHNIGIPVVEFKAEDIVRSDIVARLVKMFMKE
jgi:phosphate starvation-inducible PhoH-like protein